jgi:hypothetical protein
LLRAMVQDFAEALLGAEVDALCGAAYGERSPERSNRRNGYRERDWDTRVGSIGSGSRCRSCVRAPTSRTGRRAARAPQRRRTARSELGPHSATPARPWRQPAAQRRALPDRDHAGALQPGRTRLPRAQTQRRQEQTRSTPLPQMTPRPRRLQDPKSEPCLDIGATLAHPTDDSHPIERRTAHA